MKKNKLFLGILISVCVLCLAGLVLISINVFNGDSISNNEPNETVNEEVNNEPKLTCFDFIDKQMQADGYTYLKDAKWGRGENNFFIVDLMAQEFQLADLRNTIYVPADWYNDYNRWAFWTYSYADKKVWSQHYLFSGGSKENENAEVRYDANDVAGNFYDFQPWMEYYINQTNKFGCTIDNLTVEKMTGEYKTLKSTATITDVISYFDRTSEDGIVRYFNDVHVEGNIEDHPRYKEVQTKEEYYAIVGAFVQEQILYFNVLFKDPTKKTMFPDLSGVKSAVLKEFTKDVIFTQTSWIGDDPDKGTMGVYFIYVDNPNGEFEYMYMKPTHNGKTTLYYMDVFEKIKTPYEGFAMMVNKYQAKDGPVYELASKDLRSTIEVYLRKVQFFNPDFKYSKDFATNYTRPFNKDWQEMMGLTEFFDEKYGFINHDVQYAFGDE